LVLVLTLDTQTLAFLVGAFTKTNTGTKGEWVDQKDLPKEVYEQLAREAVKKL
jgi:hypothetical protein